MSTKKTKTKAIYDDHDDAHFVGNPAYRKHRVKNRVGVAGKGHPAVKVTKKQSTRKRVGGK